MTTTIAAAAAETNQFDQQWISTPAPGAQIHQFDPTATTRMPEPAWQPPMSIRARAGVSTEQRLVDLENRQRRQAMAMQYLAAIVAGAMLALVLVMVWIGNGGAL